MNQQNNYGGTNNQVETGEDNTNFIATTIYYQQAAKPTEDPIRFNMPFLRNRYFTGREELLTQLHEDLQQQRAAALSGLGGIGKTQTAVEYAYRYFEKAYYWVFWVRAETELELSTDFGNIARALALPQQEAPEIDQKIEAVQRWFANHKDWLLIFDNVDRPALLQKFCPQNPQGYTLVTSRAPVLDAIGIDQVKQVTELPRQESIALLLKRAGQEKGAEVERAAAEKLAAEFDDLPLALEQAGAYIREQQIRIQDYWTSYQQQRFKLLEQHPAGMNYAASVATTWAINFQAVQDTAPASADVLQLSALLAADAIPYELLVKGAKQLGDRVQTALAEAEADPLQLGKLLKPLADYSLIKLEPAAQSYSIHRLVQDVLRQAMTPEALQQWVNRAVAAVDAAFPTADYHNWTACARLLPQVEAMQPYESDELDQAKALGRLLNQAGYYLKQRGQYDAAEPLYQRSLQIWEAKLGTDHPDVARSLNNLAALYRSQGRYEAAEPLYQRSLQIWEAKLGTDHPDVARSLNNLAALYRSQGRYEAAEPLYQRSLQIWEAKLGTDHPDVANSLNNLAALYRNQGRYEAAEPLYQRSLQIREAKLGADHPDVATSLNDLALLYDNQGRYDAAEPLYKRNLEIYEQRLGKDHPWVATSLNNLAALYRSQGRYEAAEPLYQRSLQIYEAKLGTDHPDVANSLNNLAALYRSQGRYEAAEPLYQRSLQIREAKLGTDHPDVATSLNNLAALYDNQGRYEAAEPLYQRSLQIWEAKLGTDHPDVALSLNNLAELYRNQGRYEAAEPLYQRSLQIREAKLGTDHPSVATSLNNLAVLYDNQGRYEAAEPLYQRSLKIDERCYGTDHPEVATDLNNLAVLYDNQGRYEAAEPLYQRSLKIYEATLGTDHPSVATSLNNLAALYDNQRRYDAAEPLYKRAISISEQKRGAEHPTTVLYRKNLQQLQQKTSQPQLSSQPAEESRGWNWLKRLLP